MNKFTVLTGIILLAVFSGACVSRKIEKELKKSDQNNHYFRGLVVYDIKKDKERINYNGHKYFTPASNVKLFTFYTAYRTFKDSVTGLQYIRKNDSLIIRGTADPSLLYGFEGNQVIDFLANASGQIYLEDAQLDDDQFGSGWAWDDYMYDYQPEKSRFPVYGNLVSFSVVEDQIMVNPPLFKRFTATVQEKKAVRDFYENNFYIDITKLKNEKKVQFKTSNQLVADLLSDEIGKKVVVIPEKERIRWTDFKSISYDSLYTRMLHVSDNFIAEQLMLQVGFATGSFYNTKKGIVYSLENYLDGIPQKPRWVDGSGLSRYNLFTPESIVFLLKKMYREIPHEKLFTYLSAGGYHTSQDDYSVNGKPYVYGKTGTLSNNHNISGYLLTKKGNVLVFSFMNNHYMNSSSERKKEMAKILEKLYKKY